MVELKHKVLMPLGCEKKNITVHPGKEQQRNCSLINANLNVLSNLHLNSMKSLGVHDLPKSSPNSDFT